MTTKILQTIISIVCTGLLLITANSAIGAPKLQVIDKYFFGELVTDDNSKRQRGIKRLPNVPDRVCFGWVIKVAPRDELIKITEIFTLPATPEIWGGIEGNPYSGTTTSADGKVATTKLFMPLAKGELENSWCLSEGDPSGIHHIVVLNDAQVLAEFEFEVYD